MSSQNRLQAHRIASGDGWKVTDVVCTAGPQDPPFDEQHSNAAIAIVVGGTFQYRSSAGRALMTPGALLLGNPGECFTCGHEHAAGDRCISLQYTPEFFERMMREAGGGRQFRSASLPPIRPVASLSARAAALAAGSDPLGWEQLAIEVLARAAQIDSGAGTTSIKAEPSSLARVTRVLRMIENEPGIGGDLGQLAGIARLSPYHFLRTFQQLTGVTPHQYLVRMRLRRASMRLKLEDTKIADIALDCGFGDVSNFNRAFRTEFGMSPRRYRGLGLRRTAALSSFPL